jgi:hypothetical protein
MRKRADPYYAHYVISGRDIAESYDNAGTARFAFDRLSKRFKAGLILLWKLSPDKRRYDLIDGYRFKGRPL